MNVMRDKISELIVQLRQIIDSPDSGRKLYPNAYVLLSGMIKTVELIGDNLSKDPPDVQACQELARGLGRAVTDDFNFSESQLGRELSKLHSDIEKMANNL